MDYIARHYHMDLALARQTYGGLAWALSMKAKAILIDSRHLTGDCGHGINGISMTWIHGLGIAGPGRSLPNWWVIPSFTLHRRETFVIV